MFTVSAHMQMADYEGAEVFTERPIAGAQIKAGLKGMCDARWS
jgi:hypothetical protein